MTHKNSNVIPHFCKINFVMIAFFNDIRKEKEQSGKC